MTSTAPLKYKASGVIPIDVPTICKNPPFPIPQDTAMSANASLFQNQPPPFCENPFQIPCPTITTV